MSPKKRNLREKRDQLSYIYRKPNALQMRYKKLNKAKDNDLLIYHILLKTI